MTTINTNKMVADLFCILDGKPEMKVSEIKAKMAKKGYSSSLLDDTVLFPDCLSAVYRQMNIDYANETPKEEERTMKEETKNLTIETIIDNLKSGKKEHTLKKAKEEAAKFGFTDTADIRTKKEMITYMTGDAADTDTAPDSGTIVVDTIPEKTDYQKKQDNILISMVAIRDSIRTMINSLQVPGTTLKQAKTIVSALLNTEARKNLSPEFITIITEANNCRVKKDYISELRIALKEIDSLIEQEQDNQDRKEPVVVSIPEKTKALTPDTAMLIEQLDIKERSRFDTLSNMITLQNKKIDELGKKLDCYKNTINILLNRLETVDSGSISTNKETPDKSPKKPQKTQEEIQAENRDKFITGLKGINKTLFDMISKNTLSMQDLILSDSLEDFTKKQIKDGLKCLVSVGLIIKVKDSFTIAKTADFKGDIAKGKVSDTTDKKPVKKQGKRAFKRGGGSKIKEFIASMISEGKYTRKDVIEAGEQEGFKASTVKGYIVDGKNPKYNKFDSIVKEDKKTKTLSF